MESLVFSSRDVADTEEFLNSAYTTMQIGSSSEHFHAEVIRDVIASVSIDRIDIGFDMQYDADPLGRICLCLIESGGIEDQETDGWRESFGPGEVFAFAPPDRPYRGTIRHSRYNIVMFDPQLLTQVAGISSAPVRLLDHRPVSPAAGRQLIDTISYLRDSVLSQPDIPAGSLVASTASQLLAASVLNAFPSTVPTETVAGDRRDAHPATLRRAIDFIESHPQSDLSLADIARAVSVTPRAVQLAFQHHLGTTPMGYVRRVRLALAHQALQEADAATTSVTSIAAHWGFHHHGRFAAAYRAEYGQSPRTTLHSLTESRE
ncbi:MULTISPECIES: helix-turn-helix transcriptional regulator [unclassified Kribbella]|uniref:helix-turn-helix transcriptional regulator n=1 Tax=unclassified Kribbella TaxID=2644121 RepID=UPI0033D5A0A6